MPFVALLASPEIEAWFIADWEEGFGRQFSRLAGPVDSTERKHLRAHVEELLGGPPNAVESYGGGLSNGACAHKLSDKLASLLTLLGGEYSKRTHGQDMLLRVRPNKVAEVCTTYFSPALRDLKRATGDARARS
ncbi:MAG: hypothetical protein R3F14_41995 [Polyangiaceae bacterium]